jgi:virginiamycin B lyase
LGGYSRYSAISWYIMGKFINRHFLKRRFVALVMLFLLALFLASCGDSYTSPSANGPVGPIDSPSATAAQPTTQAIQANGIFKEFALPQTGSGLMRPAIDHEGRIWFGEMGHNYLAMLDPHTGVFQQVKPPRGLFGIMGIQVASDDTIWFAEQYANYIGHYFPATKQFHIYPLATVTAPDPSNAGKTTTLPEAPNDLAIDAHGDIWFTELNASAIGRLDPLTGSIRQYALTSSKSAQALDPYGITVDPRGDIWFTEASNSRIGRLDPISGAMRYYNVTASASNAVSLMEIASDPHGIIYATSFNSGLLVALNPQTGAITRYFAPSSQGNAGGLYGLCVTPDGQVWVTVSAIGVIARLDTSAGRFIYYNIPTSGSLPLGIVAGAHATLWFTEAGSDKIGMLKA